MSRSVAFPFLTIPDESVSIELALGPAGNPLSPFSGMLEGWDYAQDLELDIRLDVDFPASAAALDIPVENLELLALFRIGTGRGSMSRRVTEFGRYMLNSSVTKATVRSAIAGDTLSGNIAVSVQLLLESKGHGGMLSPDVIGARLWEYEDKCLLEDGGDSRFPIGILNFSQHFAKVPSNAPWYLEWDPLRPSADFSGTVRIHVNSATPWISDRVISGDRATLQALLGDVISQMVGKMLDDDDLENTLSDCEDGSVGKQIERWLDMAFAGQTIGAVRSLRDESPGAFRAAILASADPGDIDD